MSASTTTGFLVPMSAQAVETTRTGANRRRRISPEAGHALVILGHAIEYLTDEYIHEGGLFSANSAQMQAVQMLMALNRQIYFKCPEVPPIGRRLFSFLHLQAN